MEEVGSSIIFALAMLPVSHGLATVLVLLFVVDLLVDRVVVVGGILLSLALEPTDFVNV